MKTIILDDKNKRHKYMTQYLRMSIAFQVRLLRLQREWNYEEAAKKCRIKKEWIIETENWDSEFPPIDILKKIASAFDCALKINFCGWEEIINTLIQPYIKESK